MFTRPIKAISAMRLYVACSGIIVSCVLLRRLDSSENEGFQMGFLIALFSAFAMADVIINDLSNDNIVYERAKRWRNIGFMVLGMLYAGTVFFLLQYNVIPVLLIVRLVIDAVACSYVALAGVGEVLEETQRKPPHARNKPMA